MIIVGCHLSKSAAFHDTMFHVRRAFPLPGLLLSLVLAKKSSAKVEARSGSEFG